MEMKKIYKSLMILAAALTLPLMLNAQTVTPPKYKFNAEKGIGYNKYLLSTTPDDNGEYMLRIENFITGNVKATAIPTDFILVLDVSGSMLYDYRATDSAHPNAATPTFIRKADNDSQPIDIKKLRLDDGQDRNYRYYTYNGGALGGGTIGSAGSSIATWFTWANENNASDGNPANLTRYYYYEPDETFYRLYKYNTVVSGTRRYYTYFDRVDADGNKTGERRYVVQGEDNNITTTTTMPTNITGNTQVMLIDNAGSKGYQLYRLGTRKDALKSGVNAFLDKILEENQKDDIWASDATRHQVSIIAFSANNIPTTVYSGALTDNTRIAQMFHEITSSNVTDYEEWDELSKFTGSTYIGHGVTTGKNLLTNLQQQPNMQPLNDVGGPNRNKVMIVFTDGEPTGGRNTMGMACNAGVDIKATGAGKINGKIYSINLAPNLSYAPAFLQHLSSNYPDGRVTNANSSSGPADATYSGTGDPDGPYYVDATKLEEGLEEVFRGIASNNTGALNTTLVAVDMVSDSFLLPFTTDDLDRVTMYTAECIGLTGDTIIDEQNNPHAELAFAKPIKVDERRGLQHLWVLRKNSSGVVEWRDLGGDGGRIDIDDDMTFRVSEDGTKILINGFNYADLWCGEDAFHENTRQMASDDPNAEYALPGYRGFKMIFEFPIKLSPDALGGVNVPTNDPSSGLYKADSQGNPSSIEVPYPEPDLPVPVKLIVRKAGLTMGESANFTVQRKLIADDTAEYEDVLTFVLTGGVSIPEIRIPNLDPAYYYKVKEGNWSWAYEGVSPEYSTENPSVKNPIVFENNPIPNTPNHAEAKATNKMQTWSASSTSTVNSK